MKHPQFDVARIVRRKDPRIANALACARWATALRAAITAFEASATPLPAKVAAMRVHEQAALAAGAEITEDLALLRRWTHAWIEAAVACERLLDAIVGNPASVVSADEIRAYQQRLVEESPAALPWLTPGARALVGSMVGAAVQRRAAEERLSQLAAQAA